MTNQSLIRRPPEGGVYRRYGHLFLLAGIAVLSFVFNFYAISKVGYGNEYYAAAVKSMSQSFHNFFYVSFDPAGLVSVDKPPLGLWIQTLFVLAFGYHGWAMLLPQALAGTGSCIMLYVLTAKRFGRPAGLIASLVFALTPIVVVASRNSTMDMQLVLTLLAATWFLFKAIDTGRWRFLFTAALFVGIGFNIKMLQAYMILPAVAVVYLVFSKEKLARRFIAAGISLGIMAIVSFAWVVAVDMTPASDRPYVDSSTNNTVLELILGHNGVERLVGEGGGGGGQGTGAPGGAGQGDFTPPQMQQGGADDGQTGTAGGQSGTTAQDGATDGQTGGPGGFVPGGTQTDGGSASSSGDTEGGFGQGFPGQGGFGQNGDAQQAGGMRQGGGGIGSGEIGTASPLRLWSANLFGQISWLLPLAFFAILVSLKRFSYKKRTAKQGQFVYWVLWLGVMGVFFSFAGFYHRYYLCMMAPAIAVLTGIGVVSMIKAFRAKQGWKRFLLPLSLVATLVPAVLHVWSYTALRGWLVPLMIIAGAVSLIAMLLYDRTGRRAALAAASVLMAVSLLAAPIYWSLTPVWSTPNATTPYAGPELVSQGGQDGGQGGFSANGAGGLQMGTSQNGAAQDDTQQTTSDASSGETADTSSASSSSSSSGSSYASLQAYLVAHYKAGSYLVMTQRASDIAQLIIDTGLPAVAYGGFLGSDNSLTVDQLKTLVKEGKVTYFLLSSQGGMGRQGGFAAGTSASSDTTTSNDTSSASASSDGAQTDESAASSGGSDQSIASYVTANATLVDASEYGGSSQGGSLYYFGS